MSLHSVILAQDWKEYVQQAQDKLQEFNGMVPEWIARTGLPTVDPMPVMDYWADGALAFTALALLIALWRLLRLRIFRSFFAVVAAVLMSYYPAAYGAHWLLYEYDKENREAREVIPEWETKAKDNIQYVDWGIMGGGVLMGLFLLLITKPSRYNRDDDDEPVQRGQEQAAPWHAEAAQRQAQHRQQGGQNPFDFGPR